MNSAAKRKIFAAILIILYFDVRFVFDSALSQISPYASYAVEVIFVAVVAALFSRGRNWRLKLSPETGLHAIGALAAGAVALLLASFRGFVIPFDFGSGETVLFLLLIGPVLEEFVFRLAHWDAAEVLTPENGLLKRDVPWIYTSVLFSFGHFFAFFFVGPELKPFIAYQTVYTLLLGSYCGWCRLRTGGIVLPILVHLCFNFGFFAAAKVHHVTAPAASAPAPESAAAPDPVAAPQFSPELCPRVLVVDVPVDEDVVIQLHPSLARRFTVVRNLAFPTDLPAGSCKEALERSEELLEVQKGKAPMPSWVDQAALENVRTTLEATHGYNVVGLIARGTKCAQIHFIGVPATNAKRLANPSRYKNEVESEWGFIKEKIRELQPQIVSVSASESYSENKADLQEGGLNESQADAEAMNLTMQWKQIWIDLLKTFPKTNFFVAAGNGGLDWKGDTLIDEKAVADASFPAFMQADNLFPVGAIDPKTKCLSGFSNFGSPKVRVAAIGEYNEAAVPCSEKPTLRLSGTSQATAEFTNATVRAIESGVAADAYFKSLSHPSCLNGKVEFGMPAQ